MSQTPVERSVPFGFIRRFLSLFLPVALLVGAGTFMICRAEHDSVHAERAGKAEEALNVGVAAIGRTLQVAEQDILYLAGRRANQRVLENPSESNLVSLASDWVEFSQAKRIYDEIRWIDENGMERVRVDFKAGRPIIAPSSELQNKRDRYFFIDAIGLEANQIYVSPLDLNVEYGRIDVPYKPTIRLGLPMIDSKGTKRGLLMVNYSAMRLLARFASNSISDGNSAWLVNQEGYWLKGPSSDEEFGFLLGRSDLTIGHRYPDAWERISSEEKGQFETGEGLWTFVTVRPLQGNGSAVAVRGESSIPSTATQSDRNAYLWKAVLLLPAAQYNAGLSSFAIRLASESLLVLGLFFLAIWRLVKSQIAEQDARANLEKTVEERTHSLQEANHNLSVEQLRLRSLLQTIPDLIWLKDTQGIYLWCNPSAVRIFGMEEKDIIGHSDYDLIPRELADTFNKSDKEAINEGRTITTEQHLTYANNEQQAILEITKAPVRTSSGKLVGVLGIGHDITERMEAQERERRYKNIYRALSATNEAIIHQLDETALFELVCRIAVDYGGMCLAWIGVADFRSKKIITAANYGRAIGYAENINVSILPDVPEGNGPTGMAFRENRYIVIRDYGTDERVEPWRDLAAQYGIKSGAVFPILRAGKPYAIFSIHSEKLDAFDDKVIALLERMANNISFALDNFDRDALRSEAERAVKEREARLRRIIDEAPFPMMVHAEDGEVLQNNRSLTQITGYTSSEIPTIHDWTDKAFGEQAEQVREAVKHLYGIKNQVDNGEFIIHCKDGTTRIWHFVSSPIGQLEDGRRAVISMAVDVTERTKAEEELREKEQLLSLFVENAPAAIAMFDTEMRYLAVSRRLLEEFHTPQANLIGLSHYQVVPNMPAHFIEAHRRAMRGETVRNKEDVIVLKNGRREWVQWEVRPWFIRGEIGGILLFVDFITDSKEAEERERHLKNMYHALSATNQAIIHCASEQELLSSVCRIVVRFSQMALAWIGRLAEDGKFTPLAIEGKAASFVRDSIPCLQAGLLQEQDVVGTEIRKNNASFVNDINSDERTQICRQEAAAYGLKAVATLPLNRGQKVYAMLVAYSEQSGAFTQETASLLSEMSENISFALDNFDREVARLQAEDSMRLAALVYQDSSEGMMVTDAQNRIIAVNPAFEGITGYKAEEVIGKNPSILKSGRQDEEFYRAMWRSISTTGRWRGELWNRAKNGSEFAELITINTSYNPDGSVLRRVALFSDITEKKQSDDLIWHQANFDALTGLPNRNLFRDHLRHEIRNARRTNLPIALMFLDLDGFKDINDTLGHDMGDLLLKEIARRLQGCVREIDTVARLGGDEFTVILTELQDPDNVNRVARHILGEIARPVALGDEVAHISASIGITLYPQDASELEELLKNADQAMYAAKQGGRNQYHFFTQEMQEAALSRMRLVNDLRGALESSQFEIVFQPIIELGNGCISKAEALIRWRHPTRGMISPEEFISAAEDTGMITSFGNWMMQEAVRQVAKWREMHHPLFQISVNVSPAQLKNGNISLSTWSEYLRQTGVGGDAIVVEITEGLLLDSNERVRKQILEFRDAGIEVALDDFGTGYSSLSYLKKFDIDYIKIDQSFVRNLEHDADDMALCEAMIVMAHKLGMKVIAEGVETEEQRQKLAMAECDYAQGFLFSKPLSAGELGDLLRIGSSYCREKR